MHEEVTANVADLENRVARIGVIDSVDGETVSGAGVLAAFSGRDVEDYLVLMALMRACHRFVVLVDEAIIEELDFPRFVDETMLGRFNEQGLPGFWGKAGRTENFVRQLLRVQGGDANKKKSGLSRTLASDSMKHVASLSRTEISAALAGANGRLP
jgi:hypothetical protein